QEQDRNESAGDPRKGPAGEQHRIGPGGEEGCDGEERDQEPDRDQQDVGDAAPSEKEHSGNGEKGREGSDEEDVAKEGGDERESPGALRPASGGKRSPLEVGRDRPCQEAQGENRHERHRSEYGDRWPQAPPSK